MNPIHRAIRSKLHIKRRDNLPYTGWRGTRGELAELFAELDFRKGADVGTFDASYAEILCQTNSNLDLLCVDTRQGVGDHNHGMVSERAQSVQEKLKPYNTRVVRSASLRALESVADGSLDFIYVDDFKDFHSVMVNLLYWVPKVKPHGIVSGSGFWHGERHGVVCAVEAYVHGNNIRPWYLAHRDKAHSWLWVN